VSCYIQLFNDKKKVQRLTFTLPADAPSVCLSICYKQFIVAKNFARLEFINIV